MQEKVVDFFERFGLDLPLCLKLPKRIREKTPSVTSRECEVIGRGYSKGFANLTLGIVPVTDQTEDFIQAHNHVLLWINEFVRRASAGAGATHLMRLVQSGVIPTGWKAVTKGRVNKYKHAAVGDVRSEFKKGARIMELIVHGPMVEEEELKLFTECLGEVMQVSTPFSVKLKRLAGPDAGQ